jgi:membrane-associated phospholipid phosphatase
MIKHLIVKPIYNLLKVQSLPLLGIGKRPVGATSCTFILDDIPSTSYGMPSGHSQIIWTFGIYIICKIIDKWHKTTTNQDTTTQLQGLGYIWVISSILFILSIMVYVSYSRVYIEGCHTIQQVVVGGMLGVLIGFLIYYYENDGVNLLAKILY